MSSGEKTGLGLLRYRIIILTLSPLIFLYTAYRSTKDGGLNYFLQRFGFALPKINNGSTWIHCASVGEVNTALPLIQALTEAQPNRVIVVSTTTPTGKHVLLKKTNATITHFYLPLDFNSVTKRALRKINPKQLILLETEIWPNLIHHCKSRNMNVSIVNARLSSKTLNTYSWLIAAYNYSLKAVDAVYAKNKSESDKFEQLGSPSEKTHIVGSLKFANLNNQANPHTEVLEKPFWLAASTHEDEELRIVGEWQKHHRDELLVIAPRHPERRERILKQLKPTGLTVQLRSHKQTLNMKTDIYIADTLGELDQLIKQALVVFMGGSLIQRGGHNFIEAARIGKAVLTGPSIDNFSDEFEWLNEHEAIVQVDNEKQLIENVLALLDNKERRSTLENNASNACLVQSDVIDRYVALLS